MSIVGLFEIRVGSATAVACSITNKFILSVKSLRFVGPKYLKDQALQDYFKLGTARRMQAIILE